MSADSHVRCGDGNSWEQFCDVRMKEAGEVQSVTSRDDSSRKEKDRIKNTLN